MLKNEFLDNAEYSIRTPEITNKYFSHWSFEAVVLSINPSNYNDQWEPILNIVLKVYILEEQRYHTPMYFVLQVRLQHRIWLCGLLQYKDAVSQ